METKTQKIIRVLGIIGAKEVPSKSKKYSTFTVPGHPTKFYFVGKAGAFRVGVNSSSSMALDSAPLLKIAGNPALNKK